MAGNTEQRLNLICARQRVEWAFFAMALVFKHSSLCRPQAWVDSPAAASETYRSPTLKGHPAATRSTEGPFR